VRNEVAASCSTKQSDVADQSPGLFSLCVVYIFGLESKLVCATANSEAKPPSRTTWFGLPCLLQKTLY
jgi:hypothetical protein